MRFLIINADYPKFLVEHYLRQPGLHQAGYAEQLAARNASLFGVADFYSRNFAAHGHEAMEVHVNNLWLQYAWARENGLRIRAPHSPLVFAQRHGFVMRQPPEAAAGHESRAIGSVTEAVRDDQYPERMSRLRAFLKPVLRPVWRPIWRSLQGLHRLVQGVRRRLLRRWELKLLRAQIQAFQPDVILNQELAYLPGRLFDRRNDRGYLLMGQIASILPEGDGFENYDLVISSLPNQVAWFRDHGVKAELNRLAFDPSTLGRLGPAPPRDISLSFVGSLSPDHEKRIAFLEHVATRAPLKVWGNGIERLPKSSPLHACYQGEAWGRDMYAILRRSKITLNFHIDLAEDWANNMRLYEATGMGALLLTDQKRNLAEIFVPGEHVAAYTDAEDCVRQIRDLLADDATRERIAAAGQQHAIKTQNYLLRTREIAALAETLRPKS
ncbi:MAG TPA: glycosyltransferase [Rhizomicrobium sp.]|nr:glycosyltransferase [Rhizomicrobium sp.]